MKNTVIIGDSYSTYEGFIPNGYLTYYSDDENASIHIKPCETWWMIVSEKLKLNIVQNNSWSGSTIGYTGYDNSDNSASSSFIYRLENLIKDNFFEKEKIDTVIVFGGTNDSWCDAPLGEKIPGTIQKKDLYFVIPAIQYFFGILKEKTNVKNVYVIINTELKNEIESFMYDCAIQNGFKTIKLENIEKLDGHPAKKGMEQIAFQIINGMNTYGEK